MAVNLTAGAVAKMSTGQVTNEKDLMPVVQVMELKLVQSKSQAQPELQKERYRLALSDGIHTQQGMLGTTKNDLVKSGLLQSGSIIQLTQFVCSVIQHRRIVIVVELEVVMDKYNIIGNPVPLKLTEPVQSPNDQRGPIAGNTQPYAASTLSSGSMDKQNTNGPSLQQTRVTQMHGGSHISSNPDSGRYAASNTPHVYPKSDFGAGSSAASNGFQVNQHVGLGNSRADNSWPPQTTYSRPVQPTHQPQPPPMYSNRGPVAKNEAPPRIIPIAALNPYQGRWTIKARVTSKGELRHYNNARGDGKVFSFDLLDADGGEIRVTCFNAVADQFYNQIEAGGVYLVSRGSLRPAQKNFNHLRNDYEVILDNASTIQNCNVDDISIPQQQFHFCLIGDVENLESNSIIDVIGVVSSISPTASIMRKNGTETQKRSLQLKDMSGRSVELTLWGNFCNSEGAKLQNLCDSGAFPVLAVKAARVSEFNGKAIGTIASSQLFIDPDRPESRKLREWFEREGRNMPSISISREMSGSGRMDPRKTISQIKDEKLGMSEKPDWISVCATIIYMKLDNFCYTACPVMNGDRACNKKVINNGDGTWRCDKCDRCVNECDYRYILQFQIQDHTGITWVTAFQETGEEIMGISAKDLYYVKFEHQDDDKFAEIVQKVNFSKYIFKLKIKEETFSDEQRVKATVVKAEKVNYSNNSRLLLEALDSLQSGDANSVPANGAIGNGMVNQVGQNVNQYTGISPKTETSSFQRVAAEPGQYMGGSYSTRPSPGNSVAAGGYGGGIPRQHFGGY